MKTTAVSSTSTATPPTARSGQTANSKSVFVMLALEMSWKLAITVLVPIIAGVYIDRAADTGNLFLFIGLGLAVVGSSAVLWGMMKKANSVPVPKLSATEKRKVQQRYEEEDKEKDA